MKIKRILLITLLVFVLVVTIIPLVGYQMLKSRDIRSFISKQVQNRTGWSLSYSNHEISLFSGIILHDLDVSGPEGFTMTAAEIQLKPSYFKLLTGTLFLKEATILQPHIRLVLGPEKSGSTQNKPATTGPSEPGKPPVGLITVLNGRLEVVRPRQTVQINGIEFSITPEGVFDGSFQPGSAGNRLIVSGNIDDRMQLEKLRAELDVSDIASLAELMDAPLPIAQLEADIELTLEPQKSGRAWNMKMETRTMELKPGFPEGNIPFQINLSGTASDKLDQITLSEGQCSIGELFFSGSGNLLPEVELQLTGHELPVADLTRLIPPDVSPFPPSLSLNGMADLKARISGSNTDVQLQFDRVKASPEGIPPLAVTGELSVSGPDIRIPEIRLEGDWLEATVQGGIGSFLSDHPTTELAVHIHRATIPPATTHKETPRVEDGSEKNHATQAEPIPVTYPDFEGVRHRIGITADRLLVNGIELLDLNGRLQADDNRVQFDLTRARVMDGDLDMKATIKPDGQGIRFTVSGNGKQIKPKDTLKWRLPLEGGIADFRFTLSGSGNRTDQIRDGLTGSVDYSLSETRLRDTPVLRQLSEILNTELAGQRVKEIKSTFSVEDGWIYTGDPVLRTEPLSIQATGRFSLAGNLDLKPKINLTAETSERLPGTLKKLTGSGPVEIPFTVTGTWSKPSVKPDTGGIVKDAADQLKKKLLKKLFK